MPTEITSPNSTSNPTGLIALCGAIDFQPTVQLFDPVLHFASGESPAVHHAQREIVDSHLHASIVQVAGYRQIPERLNLKHGGRGDHVAHRFVQDRMLGKIVDAQCMQEQQIKLSFFDFAFASKSPAAISFAERSPAEGTLHAQGEHICNGVQLDATEVQIGSHRFANLQFRRARRDQHAGKI